MKRIISQVNRVTPRSKAVGTSSRDLVGQLAEKGFSAGAQDHAGRVSADDVGAHETDVRQVERIVDRLQAGLRVLLGRHRLAAQGRLVDEQVLAVQEPEIGWDHVAGRQAHDVARHQHLHRQLGEIGRLEALDAGRGLHHRAQPGGGFIRSMLLDEGGHDRQHHHDDDHDGGPDIAEKIGGRGKRQQQRVQRIFDAPPDLLCDRRLALAGDQIGAVGREALRSHVGREPLWA
jgi:hypothetical protein